MRKMLTATVIIAASVSLGACSKKAPQNLPIAPAGPSQGVQASPSTAIVPGSQSDFRAQMAGKDAIFFDTDRFNIDDIDAAALRSQAQWLARYPQKRAIIEGHADERGTRDYNLALGERRANSAKNYLASLGVDASRLTVVSYGKERPFARGSDEASWAQNRRAVTVTIDAGQM